MTTKTWTVVIVTLTLLVAGCSHAERTAVRAAPGTSTVGLTTVTPSSDLPSSPPAVPITHEVLTPPGDFALPQPTDAATLTSTVGSPEAARQVAIEELPALPLITPPALRRADGVEMKMLGQTGLPLMLPEIPELPREAPEAALVPVPAMPGH